MEVGAAFVPDDFEPPSRLETSDVVLEPLGPQHNDRDHAAWASSIDHIRATPGFPFGSWPSPMTGAENLADLEMHARDFAERRGFTYTVLEPGTRDVIGCVYIYPTLCENPEGSSDASGTSRSMASIKSWVRADRADLDVRLWSIVTHWLETEWPFEIVQYAPRRR